VPFETVNGVEVNLESALAQLERYKMLMDNYVDQNCSITVSYSPDEIPGIAKWIVDNWHSYVGVSFLLRADPTKTAADLGYPYLPQEVVDKDTYDSYVSTLGVLDDDQKGGDMLDTEECVGGVCPIR
jgi:ribonucleoside-triphosphate reductase